MTYILMLLPGAKAAKFRKMAAVTLCRVLGGTGRCVSRRRRLWAPGLWCRPRLPCPWRREPVVPVNATTANEHVFFDDGFVGQKVRVTSETPKRVSVYDFIAVACEVASNVARKYYERICESNPEVASERRNFKFPGAGQRETPVTDAAGMTYILMLLPGAKAAKFRKMAAVTLCRVLGGDETLVAQIRANKEAQDALPADHPDGCSANRQQPIGQADAGRRRKHRPDREKHTACHVPSPRLQSLYYEPYPQRPVSLPPNIKAADRCCDTPYGRTMVKHCIDDMAHALFPHTKDMCECCVKTLVGDICGLDIIDALEGLKMPTRSPLTLQTMLYKAAKLAHKIPYSTHMSWQALLDTVTTYNKFAREQGFTDLTGREQDLRERFCEQPISCTQ
ncbi:hypothetical protein GHT06_003804 [Daphnia sinensis]|uniref:Uncharacterized protein n=1 Tax=Daphnia sinensis TaxID=1820382 RepID=A0AAD5L2B4_9CRUS|nr:hypothetical protein GHT06_003804 [Daphnia sinensis]